MVCCFSFRLKNVMDLVSLELSAGEYAQCRLLREQLQCKLQVVPWVGGKGWSPQQGAMSWHQLFA